MLLGKKRELIHTIQMLRKEKGCKINDYASLILSSEYKDLTKMLDEVKTETLVNKITWGDTTTILIG